MSIETNNSLVSNHGGFYKDAGLLILLVLLVLVVSHVSNDFKFGLSPDSCSYINGGINLADGQGYVIQRWNPKQPEKTQYPRTGQPPLYSLLIAAGVLLSLPAGIAAWGISYGSIAGSIILVYIITRIVYGRRTAVWAGFFCAVTVGFINKGFWAWSEPSFTLLLLLAVLAFVLQRRSDIANRKLRYMILCGIFLVLSFYNRYIGIFCVVPFFLEMSIDALRDRQSRKNLIVFVSVLVVGMGVLLGRNYYYTGNPLGSARAASQDSFLTVVSSAVNGITTVFSGGLSGSSRAFFAGPVHGYISAVLLFLLAGLYIYLLLKRSRHSLILGMVMIVILSLVCLRTLSSFDPLDSHGSRLLSPVFPYIAILLAVVVRSLIGSVAGAKGGGFLAVLLRLIGVFGFLTLQAAYMQGGAADYARMGMANAPQVLDWVQNNIPEQSKILINYDALQISARTNAYPLCLVPQGTDARKCWDRQKFREAVESAGRCWFVFIWHHEKNLSRQINSYGQYVPELLRQGKNEEFVLAAKFSNGLVYKSLPISRAK